MPSYSRSASKVRPATCTILHSKNFSQKDRNCNKGPLEPRPNLRAANLNSFCSRNLFSALSPRKTKCRICLMKIQNFNNTFYTHKTSNHFKTFNFYLNLTKFLGYLYEQSSVTTTKSKIQFSKII